MFMSETKKKKGKKALIVLLCFVLVLGIGCGSLVAYWHSIKNATPEVEDTLTYDFDEEESVALSLQDAPEFEQIYEGDATELKAAIKDWATNGGEPMYSEDVINVLCIGVDTRNKNAINGLTDSMILVSVNKALGTITLTSIMRDSYAYLESPDGQYGSFNKINSAFPFYGIDSLITTLESHFKIRIDGYAMINFALFKVVIDKLGGVNVNLEDFEAETFNKNYGWDLQPGSSVNLNGDQALVFCRSRKIYNDGDVTRTQNQREVIISLLQKAATIEASEVPEYIKTFMPYLETSYNEAELVSLGSKAVMGGWTSFSVNQIVMPDENTRKAHSGDVWYWEVDYPLAAQTLQLAIYGDTNITLSENRTAFY